MAMIKSRESMQPLRLHVDRLYVDVPGETNWYQKEIQKLFAAKHLEGQNKLSIVDSVDAADCVLHVGSIPDEPDDSRARTRRKPASEKPPAMIWDYGDRPRGDHPGLYCSLPRFLFDRSRHRTFCYPIVHNECVEPFPASDAQYLFSFCGGLTSGLRGRIISWMRSTHFEQPVKLMVRGGPWNQMGDRSGLREKKEYADYLRYSRFVLCPRGNGVSSIRLFEVLKAGRVPVILANEYVLPSNIDWKSCSIVVKEERYRDIPRILEERNKDWPLLAANALRVWRENFEGSALLENLAANLRFILENNRGCSRLHHLKRKSYYFKAEAKFFVGKSFRNAIQTVYGFRGK